MATGLGEATAGVMDLGLGPAGSRRATGLQCRLDTRVTLCSATHDVGPWVPRAKDNPSPPH